MVSLTSSLAAFGAITVMRISRLPAISARPYALIEQAKQNLGQILVARRLNQLPLRRQRRGSA